MMDIEEFEKKVEPRAKRSRLEPFQAQIFELKAKGYANWQVCEWLAANGLKVSQEAVRKFIKSREEKERVHAPVSGGQSTQGQRVHASTLTGQQAEKPAASPQESTPKTGPAPAAAAPGDARKITNPAEVRQRSRNREINLNDYLEEDDK